MPSDTGKALLRGVIAEPDDDAPRLVYADWLDESGDADRAEFVRLQLRLARMDPGDPARPAGLARERELLAARAGAWLKPFVRWLHAPWKGLTPNRPRWAFRRGFLEHVTLDVEGFEKHAKSLLNAAPVREAWFPDCEGDDLEALGEVPALARLRALDLTGTTFTEGTAEFLYSPHLAGLKRLDFYCEVHDEGMGDEVWRALLGSDSLAGLEELLLTTMPMWTEVFEFVAENTRLPGLRRLGLEGVAIDDLEARLLAGSKNLAAVETLAVTRGDLTAEALEVLRGRFGTGLLLNDREPEDPDWVSLI
jgi:uncharacterized protein (TIGR02996 family)